MFPAFGKALSFLTLVLGAVFVFFHFHSAVASGGKVLTRQMTPVSRASAGALGRSYNMGVAKDVGADANIKLPDISDYTVENITAKVPPFQAGQVFIRPMAGLAGMREFVKKDGRIQRIRLSQQAIEPQAILIQEGDYDLPHLYNEIRAQGRDDIIKKDGNVYTLRMPLLVGTHASLTIADELRLSQEQTAFITNSGNLFIVHAKVTGWSEKDNAPPKFQEKHIYRPFIATWSGSHLYIAGSTIASLGYRKGKSYGLTYSTSIYCEQENPGLPRPTGVIVGSTFSDMYYGFYSYEADDVAIVNNVYANNAVYGIDPHDRSRRLIIAGNETYGSGKKHGIIISRNVNDSWIFNNYSHNNHGSGIMIDRTSENNIVANNRVAYNEGDGITFFESQNNTTYGNRIYRNGLSGVRVRNSWNIKMVDDQITDNGRVPVIVYTVNLEQAQPGRDFKEDPYTRKAGAAVQGTVVKLTDRKPVFKVDGIDDLTLSDIHILSAGKMFADDVADADIDATPEDMKKVIVLRKKL